jgi:uncharacterized lipoprotein YddW (UPF0748 family)
VILTLRWPMSVNGVRFPRGAMLAALCAPAFALATGCAGGGRAPEAPGAVGGPPPVAREFRGVWVATVGNIDWPSRRGLPVDSQKAELLAILDRAAELKLNAVIFQVRTAADAVYLSELEPWSEYLTGTQGQAPEPLWDPLAFAVEEAHKRGLELHAWFNPYRARHPSARSPAAPNHISVTRPDIVRQYGTHLWMDPGEPDVQDHTVAVMLDVVRRYDVDGIHIDDYFYPYRERDSTGKVIDFPDEASWNRYVASGGKLSRDDWRRSNVDALVRRLYREIHATKPWVKFGVSPIGIWRPGHPPVPEACCFDAYEQIYADARKWFAEGWVDYFVPQLYRPMSDTLMNYGVMLGWWAEQNASGRHLYVGMIPSRVRTERRQDGWPPEEIIGQIYVARGHNGVHGHVHFSARALMHDSLAQRLAQTVYRYPALVPPSPWLPRSVPGAPRVTLTDDGTALSLAAGPGEPPRLWVVRARYGNRWSVDVIPATRTRVALSGDAPLREVVVSAVDRGGNEGPAVTVRPHAAVAADAAGAAGR